MEKSGLSFANRSGRAAPETYPGAAVAPPVQAGMVPSALPARSAPTGVRRDFNSAASWPETSAKAADMPAQATIISTLRGNGMGWRMPRARIMPLFEGDEPVL